MIILQFATFLQFFSLILCHILRLGCKSEAKFDISYKNSKLRGTPISTFKGIDHQTCYEYCLRNGMCKSVNVNERGTCELMRNSTSDWKDNAQLSAINGWEYFTSNYSNRLIGSSCDKNGGGKCTLEQTCIDTCECPGYMCYDCSEAARIGYHCNVCKERPCGKNGHCIEEKNGFRCECESFFTGKYCKKRAATCENITCFNMGACNIGDGFAKCNCQSGFKGIQCKEKVI